MAFFLVGEKFFSLEELNKAKLDYEKSNFVNMVMRDTKSLESVRKYAPKRIEGARVDLRYYTVRLCCTFGGKKYKKQGHNRRLTGTRKVGCKAMVRLLLSDDGQSLDVVESDLDHSNHVISKEVYLHLPMQRRLDKAHKMQAETLLSVCGNVKLVQQHMQNVSGKVVLLKDIANISHKMKKQAMPNNLKSVLQQLEATGDSVVDVLVSEDNSFKGIFHQDLYMQSVFEAYPEVLLVGETFKLTGLQISAYLMLVIDGNGQSELVALLLLADESRSTVSAAIEAFQHHNPAWLKTQTIMTDNNFVERQVFTTLFPDVSLQLCLNHTLWTFRHEVTCEKMLISGSERDACLAVLRDMVYASDEAMYNHCMERLESIGCISVLEYVQSYWHDIRSQWVEGLKDQHLTLGESTVQRLESVGAKMKSVCCEIASLQQFFMEFRTFLASMRAERTHRAMMMLTRKPTAAVPEDLLPYRDYLTPYAFRMVHQQYTESLSLCTCSDVDEDIDTFVFTSATGTDTTRVGCCSCSIYTSTKLPCKHLLYVRRLREVEFDESVFDSRWKRADYLNHCQLNPSDSDSADLELLEMKGDEDDSPGCTGKQKLERRSVEQAEKYRKARHMTDQLASLCAKPGMTVFTSRMKLLQQLYESWSKGTDVALVKVENAEDTPTSTRKRGRPPKHDGKTDVRQPKRKHLKLVGRPKGSGKVSSRKTKRKYRHSSDDDGVRSDTLLDDDVEADEEQRSAFGDQDAVLLAMAVDNDTLSDNDNSNDVDNSVSIEDGGCVDLTDAAISITDISPGDDVSYIILPENSELLADVTHCDVSSRLELRPLDAMADIHMPSLPARKRGRPKSCDKQMLVNLQHHQKLGVDAVAVKQELASGLCDGEELQKNFLSLGQAM